MMRPSSEGDCYYLGIPVHTDIPSESTALTLEVRPHLANFSSFPAIVSFLEGKACSVPTTYWHTQDTLSIITNSLLSTALLLYPRKEREASLSDMPNIKR